MRAQVTVILASAALACAPASMFDRGDLTPTQLRALARVVREEFKGKPTPSKNCWRAYARWAGSGVANGSHQRGDTAHLGARAAHAGRSCPCAVASGRAQAGGRRGGAASSAPTRCGITSRQATQPAPARGQDRACTVIRNIVYLRVTDKDLIQAGSSRAPRLEGHAERRRGRRCNSRPGRGGCVPAVLHREVRRSDLRVARVLKENLEDLGAGS